MTTNTHIPPCFNYYYFYGVRTVLLNEPMCDLLASALMRSQIDSEVIDSLVKDLVGKNNEVEFDDSDDAIPSYTYSFFRNIGSLLLNKAGAELVAKAIEESAGGRNIHESLWSLFHKLMYQPSKTTTSQDAA